MPKRSFSTSNQAKTTATKPVFVRRLAVVGLGMATLSLGVGVSGASAATKSSGAAATAQSPSSQAKSTPVAAKLPRFGQSGDAVRALQSALVAKGFTLVGGIDGVFSPRTRATLRNFQQVVGFKATGRLDRRTAQILGLTTPTVAAVSAPVAVPAAPAPVAAPVALIAPVVFTPGAFPVVGSRGEDVRAIQTALIAAGVQVFGGADGVFGNGTKTAISVFQRNKNLTVSGNVDEATLIELGLLPRPVLAATIAVFPVQAQCYFTDTWHEKRGEHRLHEGVDIIANKGQAIYAVADGVITRTYSTSNSPLSGNGVRLTTADGTYFFYAHLDTIAPGIGVGTPVTAGQILGTVGATGNTTTPHLHFEVHPQGGAAVNPYPIVKAIDGCKKAA
jgi:murein DD-endopeptidase MepM/ murein hydrolase activator NlpD